MWRAVDLARESGSGAAKVPSKKAANSKPKTKSKAKAAKPTEPKTKPKVKAKTKAKPIARKSQPLKKRAGGGRA
jgi:hypothetical protein